jgi:hypothetical protein
MLNKIKTLNRGFTPAAWLPPNAITLKEGYTTLSHSAGAVRGETGNAPSSIFRAFNFILQ